MSAESGLLRRMLEGMQDAGDLQDSGGKHANDAELLAGAHLCPSLASSLVSVPPHSYSTICGEKPTKPRHHECRNRHQNHIQHRIHSRVTPRSKPDIIVSTVWLQIQLEVAPDGLADDQRLDHVRERQKDVEHVRCPQHPLYARAALDEDALVETQDGGFAGCQGEAVEDAAGVVDFPGRREVVEVEGPVVAELAVAAD